MKKLIVILCLIVGVQSYSQIHIDSVLQNFMDKWKNVPYVFGGKTEKGIDCSKLTQRIYKDVYGMIIPGTASKQWGFTQRIPKDSLRTGDLVFFRSRLSPSGWHVGLYLNDGYFFHASNPKDDIKISNLEDYPYISNYKGAGRLEREIVGQSN